MCCHCQYKIHPYYQQCNSKVLTHLQSSLYQSGHTIASHQLLLCKQQLPTDLSVSLVWSSSSCYTCSSGSHPLRHRSALSITCKLELVCLVKLTICSDRILLVSLEMIKPTETLWMRCSKVGCIRHIVCTII